MRLSLAGRIAAASALFGLLIVCVAMVLGYWALSRQLDARSALELRGKRDLVIHILSEIPSVEALVTNKHRFNDVLIGHDDVHLALVDAVTGVTLASFSPSATDSIRVLDALADSDTTVRWKPRGGHVMEAARGQARTEDGGAVRYYLALDRSHDALLLRGFFGATLLGTPILLIVVAVGAWLIASTGMAPLRRFRRHAATIGTRSLDRRMPEQDLPPELQDLAREFNAMLARIDHGYRRLQEFSADLAHELRTPIATLLGRDQVALSQHRTESQLREVLEGDVEELERLSRLIADMLFIAQAEHARSLSQREDVDLQVEALRVAEYLCVVADEKNVRVRVRGQAAAPADRLLVQRAITNLVSNAIRHARTGSTVEIDIVPTAQEVLLQVANVGHPIPPEHLERIFDRFYRVDASRARQSGGTGLGLAIVRSIMTAHGGMVRAASDSGSGRTVFTLAFPRR